MYQYRYGRSDSRFLVVYYRLTWYLRISRIDSSTSSDRSFLSHALTLPPTSLDFCSLSPIFLIFLLPILSLFFQSHLSPSLYIFFLFFYRDIFHLPLGLTSVSSQVVKALCPTHLI